MSLMIVQRYGQQSGNLEIVGGGKGISWTSNLLVSIWWKFQLYDGIKLMVYEKKVMDHPLD